MGKLWNRILILLRLRIDYDKPENAPPAFGSEMPHEYQSRLSYADTLGKCCVQCGGGSAHPIHHGERTIQAPAKLTRESARLMEEAPADHQLSKF